MKENGDAQVLRYTLINQQADVALIVASGLCTAVKLYTRLYHRFFEEEDTFDSSISKEILSRAHPRSDQKTAAASRLIKTQLFYIDVRFSRPLSLMKNLREEREINR